MKGNIQNLPVDTLEMFFEILANKFVSKITKYFEMPEYKEYYSVLKMMVEDCNAISKAKIPEDVDKANLINLYKRLEEAMNEFNRKGIDKDLGVIAKEINKVKLEICSL